MVLGACSQARPSSDASADYIGIMNAVLEEQGDQPALYREFIAEYPENRKRLDELFDMRTCVADETAGSPGDFADWDDVTAGSHSNSVNWKDSDNRQRIPRELLPSHLRWSRFFSVCPTGVLIFGNPEIDGDEARVFAQNRSASHGWGGEFLLVKERGEWKVTDLRGFWIA